jgi:UDP-N-acetylglucosamine transferase subunit ALG13
MALEAGVAPILVPRESRHGEHVDDHQDQIAQELARRGLAIRAPVDELSYEHVASALRAKVEVTVPPPMTLPGLS